MNTIKEYINLDYIEYIQPNYVYWSSYKIHKEPVYVRDFIDINEISIWVLQAVSFMQRYQIISGMENNSFGPQAYATRAEAAKVLSFVHNYILQLSFPA